MDSDAKRVREGSVDLFWIGLVFLMFGLFAAFVGLCGRLK